MIIKDIFGRKFKEVTGCIHNHSEYSYDCDVPLKKILRAAQKSNLDYFTINDHNTFAGLDDKTYKETIDKGGKITIIVGAEVCDSQNNHHYLVFNTDKVKTHQPIEQIVDFYNKEKALGFVAHPKEKRISKDRNFQWKNEKILNVDAIEIWNFSSNWVMKLIKKLNGLLMVIFQKSVVRNPHKENLRFWEKYLDAGKKISAFGSVDAHANQVSALGLKFRILTHNNLFKTIRTNVLIPHEQEVNSANILKAIKNGNTYIINYRLGNHRTFFAGITKKDYDNAIFGESIKYEEGLRFYFKAPNVLKIILIRNGKKIDSMYEANGFFEIKEPGRYRIEIRRRFATWILTNYIYVTK